MAAAGDLGVDVVAIGPWWTEGRDPVQIDAVVLNGRAREATLAGEAKWSMSEDGARIVRGLERKAYQPPQRREWLRYAVLARDNVTHVPPDALVLTARDIFGD